MTEQWVMVCQGFPIPTMPCDDIGKYLAYYDPDGRTPVIRWTKDVTDALVFRSVDAALDTLRLQSRQIPLRPDGQPNRPLTAYTIELTQLVKEES